MLPSIEYFFISDFSITESTKFLAMIKYDFPMYTNEYSISPPIATALFAGNVHGVVVHIGIFTFKSFLRPLKIDLSRLVISKLTQTAFEVTSLYSTSASANAEDDSIHQ